ncbi:MAG TPA: EamA family transporter [Acidimicrobiales bacterium]
MSDGSSSSKARVFGGAGYMLLGASLIQWSAALVTRVFGDIGPSATSAWRFLLGAVVLLIFTRPQLRSWTKQQWFGALALGVSVAFMNQCFYQAIARIPLGAAVAIEYLGPFMVSALGKRSARHIAFVVLAGLGVLAIARPGAGLNAEGILFAAGSGLGWASYVYAAHRVGGQAEGFGGLAVSMSIAAVVTLPLSLGATNYVFGHPTVLARLAIVAVMAIVLGFGCELQALRRLKPSTAGVLFALDPAVAFAIGLVVLRQSIHPWDLVGMACVVIAGVGVTYDAANSKPTLVQ